MTKKEESDLIKHITDILEEIGMATQSAKNIAHGTQKMNNLERAIRLSKFPYFISTEVWEWLYKGRNKIKKQ